MQRAALAYARREDFLPNVTTPCKALIEAAKHHFFPACLSELGSTLSWNDVKSLPSLADPKILFIWKCVCLCYKRAGVKQHFPAIKKMTYLCRYYLLYTCWFSVF